MSHLNTLQSQNRQYQQAGLYRELQTIESPQSTSVFVNGKKCINFSSSNYLGLANHPDVAQALKQGIDQYGFSSTASQSVTGRSQAHLLLEEAFADFLGCERALFFNSGYMANLGTIAALANKNDYLFADKLAHASILDGCRLSDAVLKRYQHNNIEHLQKLISTHNANHPLILTEGLFGMEGDIAVLPELTALATQHRAALIVDEAHSIGVLGQSGKGALDYFGLKTHDVFALICPLGKAFACNGAIVAGSNTLIEHLIQRARTFMYTVSLSPCIAVAALKSLELVQSDSWRREKLAENIHYFRACAKELTFPLTDSKTPIQSFLIHHPQVAVDFSRHLLDKGVLVTAIRPPSVPKNATRLRIILTAAHDKQHIDLLLERLGDCYDTLHTS